MNDAVSASMAPSSPSPRRRAQPSSSRCIRAGSVSANATHRFLWLRHPSRHGEVAGRIQLLQQVLHRLLRFQRRGEARRELFLVLDEPERAARLEAHGVQFAHPPPLVRRRSGFRCRPREHRRGEPRCARVGTEAVSADRRPRSSASSSTWLGPRSLRTMRPCSAGGRLESPHAPSLALRRRRRGPAPRRRERRTRVGGAARPARRRYSRTSPPRARATVGR